MFKKLKIQLIMINVVLLTIVLAIIFSGIYFIMKKGLDSQAYLSMEEIAVEDHVFSNPNFPKANSPSSNKILSNSFFIRINPKGEIFDYSTGLTVSKDDLRNLKEQVLEKRITRGVVKDNNYNLKFVVFPKKYGFIIVFLDNDIENNAFKWLITASLTIGIISLALVFLISLYLANKAIRPIKVSWEKQNAFIADASHELRTPLAVINSTMEIVVDNEDETVKSQSKWLSNIQGEVSRMTKLVEDLLFLARSDIEKLPIYPFNISNVLTQTYEIFKPIAEKKDLNLIFDSAPDIVVCGNTGRIQQLLNIILDNAIKHTSTGGTISLKLQLGENSFLLIIKDTGEGIPKEDLDKIFERFYRVDKSRSKNNGGCGLGLSIAQCIVKEHHGNIKVFSELGNGSEFRITLPLGDNKNYMNSLNLK